jgi:hypothetical protein
MQISNTQRGFSVGKFTDTFGNQCSLQKSSSAMEDKIWLGIDNPKLVVFENKNKGKYLEVEMPENFDVNARMHLNQEQVAALLPYLQKFVETGELD